VLFFPEFSAVRWRRGEIVIPVAHFPIGTADRGWVATPLVLPGFSGATRWKYRIVSGGQVANVSGSGLAALGLHLSVDGMSEISECRVRTVSSKGKLTRKDKLVGRRSPEETAFLDDIVMFVVHSGAGGEEDLLSCERPDGSRLVLSSRAVREELKATVKDEGQYFSSHSLRKGAITHMRALGASEDDRRERGNFALGSTVMNSTYDYAVTGLGPSASNSLEGGHKPTLNELRRMVPAVLPGPIGMDPYGDEL
jgi:hypothetical protein